MKKAEQTQNHQQIVVEAPRLLDNISVVLANPKYAGNVGFAARCIKNMGMNKLLVVRDTPFNAQEVRGTATPFARDVVDAIVYYSSLQEALAPMSFVVGMTARKGIARGPQLAPREAARDIVRFAKRNQTALLFGCEDKGLANAELRFCHRIVNIPTAPDFTSINLSHAIMILCYEVFLATSQPASRFAPQAASVRETEQMFSQLRGFLQDIGFLKQENPEYWLRHIRQFFARTKLLSKDVKIVRGIMRQLEWKLNKNKPLDDTSLFQGEISHKEDRECQQENEKEK